MAAPTASRPPVRARHPARRSRRRLAVLGGVAAVAAGCGGGPGSSDRDTGTAAGRAQTTENTTAADRLPPDAVGVDEQSAKAPRNRIDASTAPTLRKIAQARTPVGSQLVDVDFDARGGLFVSDIDGNLWKARANDARLRLSGKSTGEGWAVATARSRGLLAWSTARLSIVALRSAAGRSKVARVTSVMDLRWRADGRRLAAGQEDERVTVVGGDGQTVWTRQLDVGPVLAVAWSPSGRQVAALGYFGEGRILDARGRVTGRLRYRSDDDGADMNGGCWAGERILVASQDGVARVFSTRTLRVTRRLDGADGGWVRPVVCWPGGDIAAVSGDDGVVRVWDLRRGRRLAAVPIGDEPVWGLALSPDRRTLAAVDGAGRVTLLSAGPPR